MAVGHQRLYGGHFRFLNNMYIQKRGTCRRESYTRPVLKELAAELDDWFVEQAREAVREGMASPRACTIEVHGQMALVEREVKLNLVATQDVDVSGNLSGAARKEFERLLAKRGLVLDPVGHEAWMPEETQYETFFSGQFVTLKVADEECVLLSKAAKAPAKNGVLLTEYLARGPSERFVTLAAKYDVDLEQFV